MHWWPWRGFHGTGTVSPRGRSNHDVNKILTFFFFELTDVLTFTFHPTQLRNMEQSPRVPVELQYLILESALLLPQADCTGALPSRSLPFPCNLATVCALWREVLKKHSECWTHLVFDVSSKPWIHIGAFSWSKDHNFDVLVFNSQPSLIDAQQEKECASQIMKALAPHMKRCTYVEFDLIFTSSLPSPLEFFCCEAPILGGLELNAQIDDWDVGYHYIDNFLGGFEGDISEKLVMVPGNVWNIAIPGFWFILLATHPLTSQWFISFVGYTPTLSITCFSFQEHGNFSVLQFIDIISWLRTAGRVVFRNLSLSYPFIKQPIYQRQDCDLESITFDGVSEDFISQLYDLVSLQSFNLISFSRCSIPVMTQQITSAKLELDRLPEDKSLKNAMEVWSGNKLVLNACPSFNDDFLSRLDDETESSTTPDSVLNSIPAYKLRSLVIHNCEHFSLDALFDFMERWFRPLRYIKLFGASPEPIEDDFRRCWHENNVFLSYQEEEEEEEEDDFEYN